MLTNRHLPLGRFGGAYLFSKFKSTFFNQMYTNIIDDYSICAVVSLYGLFGSYIYFFFDTSQPF